MLEMSEVTPDTAKLTDLILRACGFGEVAFGWLLPKLLMIFAPESFPKTQR